MQLQRKVWLKAHGVGVSIVASFFVHSVMLLNMEICVSLEAVFFFHGVGPTVTLLSTL